MPATLCRIYFPFFFRWRINFFTNLALLKIDILGIVEVNYHPPALHIKKAAGYEHLDLRYAIYEHKIQDI